MLHNAINIHEPSHIWQRLCTKLSEEKRRKQQKSLKCAFLYARCIPADQTAKHVMGLIPSECMN